MNETGNGQNKSFAMLIFVAILGVGGVLAYARFKVGAPAEAVGIGVIAFVVALVGSSAVQVANQWDRAVILRLGRFHSPQRPRTIFPDSCP